ncbi:MAG: ABC transporter ATP-binding protein [Desulfovibrio sp.]|jgi:iron(III) transport system ATP-binding protein|nr:ABC transporter ATP-binding protein [Desulfovibrio sp.]
MFLKIDAVFFAYPGRVNAWILAGYSLGMKAGERVGIAGPSGQGKSTLLRLIAGLERPQKGSIVIDGRLVAGQGAHVNPEDRQVGMVFQDYGLFPHMTVAQNIAYGLFRLHRNERRQRVNAMLDLIRMQDLADRHPYEISGGQQQRVAIARALAPGPKLLLLDEPLSNLDSALKAELRAEMRGLMDRARVTCLFVSHDMDDLRAVCGRIEIMGSP